MLIKAKSPIPSKTEPVVPVRCLPGGEVMVHQVNQPAPVGDGINRKNKDGVLILGDDGQYLRNVRTDPDGTVVTRVDKPIDLNMPVVTVKGSVTVENTLTVDPVTVSNMPKEIRVQEPLDVVQVPIEAKVAPINFEGYGQIVIDEPCKVYSIHLTVIDSTWVEIPGITGPMFTKEFKLNLFPLYIRLNKLAVTVKEWSKVGGYVIYEI